VLLGRSGSRTAVGEVVQKRGRWGGMERDVEKHASYPGTLAPAPLVDGPANLFVAGTGNPDRFCDRTDPTIRLCDRGSGIVQAFDRHEQSSTESRRSRRHNTSLRVEVSRVPHGTVATDTK